MVLFYITAEDAFGPAAPERRGPRPSTMPTTVSGLYDLGMRHHQRPSVLSRATGDRFEPMPDWQLDRLVIRVALYGRENLGLEPGRRAAVFGRLSWLWPLVDFAATGFGAAAVGIEHDVSDEALATVLREAEPRVVFATDAESARRVLALRSPGRLAGAVVVGEGLDGAGEGSLGLTRLLDLGGTLDTPERAQAFRAVSRNVSPDSEALWHADAAGIVRLSHAQAMARIAERLRAEPARSGDVAYLDAMRARLNARLALHAFVGDGLTSTTIGREGRTSEDIAQLRPHKLQVGAAWLEAACEGRGPRWPAGLDRSGARRRLQEVLGDRLRFVETERAPGSGCLTALGALGAHVRRGDGGASREAGH
jgi:AMP-binding enzyme